MPATASASQAQTATSCVSCGQGLVMKGSTVMMCPDCDTQIGRCGSCREQAVDFACPNCGFQGP